MNITNLTVTQGEDQFYPTPPSVARKMLEGIKWDQIETILEPSAGKGDLILAAAEAHYDHSRYDRRNLDVDAVEIDPNLRAICKYNFSKEKKDEYFVPYRKLDNMAYQSRTPEQNAEMERLKRKYDILNRVNLHMVHDDFLTYSTYKKYDLILMNPPFVNGDKHLLRALEMQKNGGSIVCLLNAETIRNPHSFSRRYLVQKLEELNADIEFVEDAFSTDAERKARVDVAIIKAYIPPAEYDSTFFERMKKAVDEEYTPDEEITALVPSGTIDQAICRYKAEVAATMELIKEYNALKPYIYDSFDGDYKSPILSLVVKHDSTYGSFDMKGYVKLVRLKYWRQLFKNDEFTGKLTSNLRERFMAEVEKMADYEFSAFNIKQIMVEMNAAMQQGVVDTIHDLFEKLTVTHSWYPECEKTRHYYDGWKTNKAHKIGKKCIIPTNVFGSYSWDSNELDARRAYAVLSDIEKAFDYLDGGYFKGNRYNLELFIQHAKENGQTRNIECTYFKVDLYKKGTIHIKFRPEAMPLVERLNIFAAKDKNWLPPNYGKTSYQNMAEEEKAVVDSFNGDGSEGSGETAYTEIMRESQYYLSSPTNNMLALESSQA